MDKYVYISYSRHDHGFVEQLSGDLRSHGISIWVDMESIEPGENWEHAIVKGIQGASVFLLVLSKSSIQSNSVRSELEIAEEAGLIIIPLAVDEIELPAALQYQLAGGQEISFAGNYTKGKDLLLTSLESILKIDTSIEQSVEKPEIRSKGYVFIS